MRARNLVTAALALGMFASSGAALRAQSITFSFGDHDRQAMREWYREHRNGPEFRRRWDHRYDNRLRVGLVVGPDLQRWARPAPPELYGRLGPLPRGYRYVIIGNRLVVVDRRWRIRDVNPFDDDGPSGYGPGSRRDRSDRFDGSVLDARVAVGDVLPVDLRNMTRPVDPMVRARLPNRPPYVHYVALGDRALLIDNAWIVREMYPL